MNTIQSTVEAILAHAQSCENTHALIICSSDLNRQDIVERLRQRFVEIVEADGDYVGQVDNIHGGKSTITVRMGHA